MQTFAFRPSLPTDYEKTLELYFCISSNQDLSIYSQILNYISAPFETNIKEGKKLTPVLPFIFYHRSKPWLYPVRFADLFCLPEELKTLLP
ncbi:MAG: Rpn family recombination-promoting nuclease/putative transposase [Caldimicrobium sp.]|nr:Rpn family recombination-promoting nuclease/putative transposase [Caldimicrobium sp.]MDW8183151.1 Rpn family recombination-promoting nuclease/putative transposase [Caldimicrobium sp.]